MDVNQIKDHVAALPRAHIGFYPTPFHKLSNLSKKYDVHVFMKREDLAGPGTISGSKTRLSEFILGNALEQGYTHVITQGVHLTNSGLQFAAASRVAGLTPILFLTRDTARHGKLEEYRGNLLLNQIMDVETHHLETTGGGYWEDKSNPIDQAMETRRLELEAEGHRAIIVPTGGAHPDGFVAHLLTFVEMIEQSEQKGITLDYIYHTAGTGTALPGLLAGKFLMNHPVKLRSIAILAYKEGGFMGPSTIVERVKGILKRLGAPLPSDESIRAEIDVDEAFIGEDYAVPSEEGIAAIKEVAQADGVFLGPVYTAKGFAGLIDHVQRGKVPSKSNVAFLHTGDTANLFEVSTVVGAITEPIQ
ncbi:unnamed protein product [Penicillium salamii]|nr:unnamed protein product [Penicillium salamii]